MRDCLFTEEAGDVLSLSPLKGARRVRTIPNNLPVDRHFREGKVVGMASEYNNKPCLIGIFVLIWLFKHYYFIK
ncbi:MAG: hypothetical protein JXQ96_09650 [Cyclobacteriaceae bacterium]